jgi:methionyl-tRNA synthetase
MAENKNYFVTTSIPYINGEPHVGHTYEFLVADVMARYARAQGKKVIFSTGTDEHGSKVQRKAEEQGKEVKQYADEISAKWREILPMLSISADRFIRTTDAGHEQRAALIWQALKDNIYKGKYSGWYCSGCEEFVPDALAKKNQGNCPTHQTPYEQIEEENYFFKLSAFSGQIKDAISTGKYRVIPKTRRNEMLALIGDKLEDISISRPKDKVSWGIPVPGDETQVMYVWFEALMNYITVLGYPEHEDFKNFWPANLHVIGKDINKFHSLVWPGILLALDLDLPKKLYVHGFVNIDNQKISKSLGNVIHPSEPVDKYGVDALRYYMLRHVPSYSDGEFTWELLDGAYNGELANELGNGVSRTAAMVKKYQQGAIGDLPPARHDSAEYEKALGDCRCDQALEVVWRRIKGLNQFIDQEKPWEIAKSEDREHLSEVLSTAAGDLLEIAGLLEPFLPDTSAKIKQVFGSGVIKDLDGSLFPRLENEKPQSA